MTANSGPPPHPLRLFNGTAIRVIVIFHRRSNRRRLTTIGVDRVWARYKKKPLPGCFFFYWVSSSTPGARLGFFFLLWTSPSITFELSVCEAERPSFVRLPWRPGPAGRGRCVSCNRFISFFFVRDFFFPPHLHFQVHHESSPAPRVFFSAICCFCVCVFSVKRHHENEIVLNHQKKKRREETISAHQCRSTRCASVFHQ